MDDATQLFGRRFEVMATGAEVLVWSGDQQRAASMFDVVEQELHRLSERLTRFDPGSDLERLNDAGGGAVSELLGELLRQAERATEQTGGRFDVGLGAELVAAGYDRTFGELDVVPEDERTRIEQLEPADAVQLAAPTTRAPSFRLLDDGTVRIEPGRRIDLGGIAKGWAADDACRALATMLGASCLVNLGGDIAVQVVDGGEPWPIGVAGVPGDTAHTVGLAFGGLATSSQDRRVWRAGSVRAHHVIDPRTGVSARTDVQRVTVIHASCMEAEVWTKALMLVGMDAAVAEARERDLTVCLCSTAGEERWTGMLASLDPPSR